MTAPPRQTPVADLRAGDETVIGLLELIAVNRVVEEVGEVREQIEVVAEIRNRLPAERAARLEIRIHGELPSIDVPRAGLGQVVASLVKNAFDATTGTEAVAVDVARHGDAVRLIVKDEGSGMPADVLSRAGEPFFTTKEPGRGLGLGLFLARLFAERIGGSLTLHSDHGTTAILDLPAPSAETPR